QRHTLGIDIAVVAGVDGDDVSAAHATHTAWAAGSIGIAGAVHVAAHHPLAHHHLAALATHAQHHHRVHSAPTGRAGARNTARGFGDRASDRDAVDPADLGLEALGGIAVDLGDDLHQLPQNP